MSLKLPAVIADHLVLQRDKPIPIWGSCAPGRQVTVSMDGQHARATAGNDGRWRVALPSRPAGGPYDLTISDGADTVVLRDVLVGEVWVCSGQSNMEWTVEQSNSAVAEIAGATWSNIRMFTVVKNAQFTPQHDLPGRWDVCDPKTVGAFSAVGYFFARKLHQDLGVPVGMLHTSWGGTAAEAWVSEQALRSDPAFASIVSQVTSGEPVVPHVDPGMSSHASDWASTELDDASWMPMSLPQTWQGAGGPNVNGAAWFRFELTLPDTWAGRDVTLSLGAIDDVDDTFFNGVPVGQTTTQTPNYFAHFRRYTAPGSFVKAGRNVIAVRAFDHWGNGGLLGPASEMHASVDGVDPCIALHGTWKFKMELELPLRLTTSNVQPTQLFNGMIAPLLNYGIRGAIWYQGESNGDRGFQYRSLLATLIREWRDRFAQGDFPFYIVELANWRARATGPGDSAWAELREAQHLAARAVGNADVACAIDLGDADDIHPLNKQDVGRRLALLALKQTYDRQDMVAHGPTYDRLTIQGATVRVTFRHTDGALVVAGPSADVNGFTVAGDDMVFYEATARIEGSDVIVQSACVTHPVAVRYAWADNPECNLYNGSGLPAYPFRTDTWKITSERD